MSPRGTKSPWSRREFLAASVLSASALALPPTVVAQTKPSSRADAVPDTTRKAAPKPPPLPAELVKEFVVAAHGNLDRTRELLAETPGLLNATWDWKAGDFEAAIGGAGHMGRRDIALFLIEQGARMDVFVAAMLGDLALVRSFLEAHPRLLHADGPHGITLVAHAKAGGEPAAEVLAYLESLERR